MSGTNTIANTLMKESREEPKHRLSTTIAMAKVNSKMRKNNYNNNSMKTTRIKVSVMRKPDKLTASE